MARPLSIHSGKHRENPWVWMKSESLVQGTTNNRGECGHHTPACLVFSRTLETFLHDQFLTHIFLDGRKEAEGREGDESLIMFIPTHFSKSDRDLSSGAWPVLITVPPFVFKLPGRLFCSIFQTTSSIWPNMWLLCNISSPQIVDLTFQRVSCVVVVKTVKERRRMRRDDLQLSSRAITCRGSYTTSDCTAAMIPATPNGLFFNLLRLMVCDSVLLVLKKGNLKTPASALQARTRSPTSAFHGLLGLYWNHRLMTYFCVRVNHYLSSSQRIM